MSKIHYFQRYSSKENTVTNNTLQLLARIYSYSPSKASEFLADLSGEPIEIGIEINQQEPGPEATPDGQIIQRSFKVLVESKVNAPLNPDQLLRHSDNFSNKDSPNEYHQKILLLLTKTPLETKEFDEVKRKISPKGVIFASTTYEEICNKAKGLFEEYEREMRDLVDDYEEYCNDTGLFDQSKYFMRIVPCGQSLEINKRHGIYFHPSDRGYTKHRFLGIYKDKTVQAIWKIDSVFDVNCKNGKLNKTLVEGRHTNDYDKKLVKIIMAAKIECSYNVEVGHRFFCGKPIETNYEKSSPGGIQGHRFVNLQGVIEDLDKLDLEGIAERLRGLTWE